MKLRTWAEMVKNGATPIDTTCFNDMVDSLELLITEAMKDIDTVEEGMIHLGMSGIAMGNKNAFMKVPKTSIERMVREGIEFYK